MSRHGNSCESRFRQNFKKQFDWCAFNSGMLLPDDGHRVAIALDHSFISKSGKKTPGLGRYWSGCADMTKRGFEILGLARVAVEVSDARLLFRGVANATPSKRSHAVLSRAHEGEPRQSDSKVSQGDIQS